MSGIIRVRGLATGYRHPRGLLWQDEVLVIAGVDLDVAPGEVAALVGPNGSGKSSILGAIIDPRARWAGQVLADGLALDPRRVAYLPQAPALTLAPWHTGGDAAAYALRIQGVPPAEAARRVTGLAARLRLEIPWHQRVDRMSGGQRVRVAVLRTLTVPEPKVFILDEPMEGLDVSTRELVGRVIREVRATGVPVILTSHRTEDLEALDARQYHLVGRPVTSLRPAPAETPSIVVPPEHGQVPHGRKPERAVGPTRFVLGAAGVSVGLSAWAALAYVIDNPGLLPGPLGVIEVLVGFLGVTAPWQHLAATLARSLAAWLVAVAVAVPLGVAIGYDGRMYGMVTPWLAVFRAVPIFLLVGVAAGLFPGKPELQRFTLTSATLVLISLHGVAAAAAAAPRRRVELARILGAGHLHRLYVLGRETAGSVFSYLEMGIALAIVATIVMETILIPRFGLGSLVYSHMLDPDLSLLFAYLLLPGLIGSVAAMALRVAVRGWRYEL